MVIVDIGCGDGGWILAQAAAHPDREYIGLELIAPLVQKAAAKAPKNATFIAGDAVAWLQKRAEGSVDEVHVYHPQPYYDPAEVHLGVGTSDFFDRVWKVLRPDGLLFFQTDNRRYGRYLLEAVLPRFEAEIQEGRWSDGLRTRRESVAVGKKLPVLRVIARRRQKPLSIQPLAPYFDLEKPGLKKRRPSKRKRRP